MSVTEQGGEEKEGWQAQEGKGLWLGAERCRH